LQKILVSACLLGEKTRYNAVRITYSHPLLQQWLEQGRVVAICPELSGGLTVPREAAEKQANTNNIITSSGKDVSAAFFFGAQQALKLCQSHHIHFALLKENSPSCGSCFIYDGCFSANKISGQGVTTELLRRHHIKVYSELTIEQLADALAIAETSI
jgi:uncharacterized protein YbbK (DUF523 family)